VREDEFRDFVAVRYADLLRTAYLLTGPNPNPVATVTRW